MVANYAASVLVSIFSLEVKFPHTAVNLKELPGYIISVPQFPMESDLLVGGYLWI